MKTVIEMAQQTLNRDKLGFWAAGVGDLEAFANLVRADEREAIYDLVMEAPFKEFDKQEEDFDGEAANAMKAMAFSLTAAIRARGSNT